MKTRELGKTGLKLSEVGFGTWQITDDPEWGKGPDRETSFRNLQHFIDLGGNHIDTASVYGWREEDPDKHPSEELIGDFLTETNQRDKIIITSKIAPINQLWPAPQDSTMASTFPAQYITKSVEDSLRSLKTDYIDVMLFHVWRDTFNNEDEWKSVCEKLTREGKVRYWGLSPNYYEPSECIRTIEESDLISVVQCIFNVFHQKPIEELFPVAKRRNVGIVACAPLDEGGLTGNITLDTKFDDGDFRGQYFGGDRLSELVRRTDGLKGLMGNETQSLAELALRFILSFDEVTSVIPGMRSERNIDRNVALSDGRKLTPELISKLRQHSWERNFYPWATEGVQ